MSDPGYIVTQEEFRNLISKFNNQTISFYETVVLFEFISITSKNNNNEIVIIHKKDIILKILKLFLKCGFYWTCSFYGLYVLYKNFR